MLNDLNPKDYKNIYIVCGFTDMRYGINGLSAIIEQKNKMNVFIAELLPLLYFLTTSSSLFEFNRYSDSKVVVYAASIITRSGSSEKVTVITVSLFPAAADSTFKSALSILIIPYHH